KPLPPTGASWVQISNPNIVLVTWKLAENGNGTILRLQETAGQPQETSITFPLTPLGSANLCDGVEDDLGKLNVSQTHIQLKFQPHEVLTVRLVQGVQ